MLQKISIMASMTHGNVIYEKTGQAPAPSKDFHQLLITENYVIWRSWKITLRKEKAIRAPAQVKQTCAEFYYDEVISADVQRVFGADVLRYVECIVNKDWLVRMKDEVLLKVISFLNLQDIANFARVCRHFRAICNSNKTWKMIYDLYMPTCTESVHIIGEERGWKKLFFSSKLQQQKEISRQRRSASRLKEQTELLEANLIKSY